MYIHEHPNGGWKESIDRRKCERTCPKWKTQMFNKWKGWLKDSSSTQRIKQMFRKKSYSCNLGWTFMSHLMLAKLTYACLCISPNNDPLCRLEVVSAFLPIEQEDAASCMPELAYALELSILLSCLWQVTDLALCLPFRMAFTKVTQLFVVPPFFLHIPESYNTNYNSLTSFLLLNGGLYYAYLHGSWPSVAYWDTYWGWSWISSEWRCKKVYQATSISSAQVIGTSFSSCSSSCHWSCWKNVDVWSH